MKRLLFVLAVLAVAGPPEGGRYEVFSLTAAAQTIQQQGSAALSKYLTDAIARGDVPGVVVTVINKDGMVYNRGFGKRSTSSNAPMGTDTIFNIASMTKAVTSAAIMILVDEGKLKLDDDVATYLPKYKDPLVLSTFNATDGSYETRPAKGPITIRHLLTHTSGIGYGFSSQAVSVLTQKTMQTELDLPLLFEPGTSWAYGASTRVLGHVVEAISGQKLDAFLDARILRPLGMSDTGYAVPTAKIPRVAAVNSRGTDGKFVERPVGATVASPVQGDGGLYSTGSDYGLFIRMLLNRGQLGQTRILSARSARTMFENHTGDVAVQPQQSTNLSLSRNFPTGAGADKWGLGFQLAAAKRPNMRTPGSGTWAGIFNTHFFIDPSREIGVVVMMQTLPFYDEASMRVYAGVEEMVYRNLK